MSLKSRLYSVLIVSANENFNSAISDLLPESQYEPIHKVSSVSAAKRAIAERPFDFIFVNSPLPDEPGTRFAIDVCTSRNSVVLIFVRGEINMEVHDKVAEYGVFTLPKPTPKPTMLQALNWMISARERLRRFEKKTLSIEEKMEEIRTVNRAKWILISEFQMSEPDAHRHIEKTAMDRCISKKEVADEIIRNHEQAPI